MLDSTVRSRGAALRDIAARGIGLRFSPTTTTGGAPAKDGQSFIVSFIVSRSCIPSFFAEDCDDCVPESIPSVRLKSVIRERDILAHSRNDIKVRFQKPDHEIRSVKNENGPMKKSQRPPSRDHSGMGAE